MERRRFIIEIIKAKSNGLWYKNMIGQKIKVKDEGHPEHVTAASEGHVSKIIYREDFKEIKDE